MSTKGKLANFVRRSFDLSERILKGRLRGIFSTSRLHKVSAWQVAMVEKEREK
jgi:hypothetical protein